MINLVKKISIRADNDLKISADLYNSSGKKGPLIIFTHGFKGFKDWGGFPYLMDKLSKAGFCTCSYNFTHNGVDNDKPLDFSRLDLFAKNTFSREIEELDNVINHFYENGDTYNIDKTRIALIGHSRGGGISILKAAEDKRVKCLITLAAVSTFMRYGEKTLELWRKQGYLEIENTRTKQMMRLNLSLLEDLEKNSYKLDIETAISKIHIPVLLIHGKEDLSVKYTEAETLYGNSDKSFSELFLLENTGHTFGVVHPFNGTTDAFENVIEKMTGFLKDNL